MRHDRSVTNRFRILAGSAIAGLALASVVMLSGAFAGGSPGAAEQLADMFATPSSAQIPADVRAMAALPSPDQNGVAIMSKIRPVRDDLGPAGSTIYAFPTTKGQVCFVLTGGPASCMPRFDHGSNGASYLSFNQAGAPLTVFGLTAPDVVGVDVVVAGTSHPATLGGRAYYYRATDMSVAYTDITALVIRFRDGTSATKQV